MSSEVESIVSSLNYVDKMRTLSHIKQATLKYRNLTCKEGSLIHDDGNESLLIHLVGTIPITYQGNVYHIPIDIYLPRGFPSSVPIVYVRPTSTMDISKQHREVGIDGRVHIPYLIQWHPSQDLVTLCDSLVFSFSREPPVHARSAHTSAARPPPTYDTVVSPEEPDPRKLQTDKLSGRIRTHLEQFYDSIDSELETEYAKQDALKSNQEAIRSALFEYEEAKASIREQTEVASRSVAALEKWLEERKGDEEGELNLDQVIQPSDEASEKLMDMVSEISAIDDTLFVLDRALSQDAIDLPSFLREVRKLSRKQFILVAHSHKIAESVKSH